MLCQTPASAGPFPAPNEYFRDEGGARLSWFITGAGAVVHAIHTMLVQVDETSTILLPVLQGARFERPLASHRVSVSGQIKDGKLVTPTAQADGAMAWSFRIPQRLAETAQFAGEVIVSQPDAPGLMTVACTLKAGTTRLV